MLAVANPQRHDCRSHLPGLPIQFGERHRKVVQRVQQRRLVREQQGPSLQKLAQRPVSHRLPVLTHQRHNLFGPPRQQTYVIKIRFCQRFLH